MKFGSIGFEPSSPHHKGGASFDANEKVLQIDPQICHHCFNSLVKEKTLETLQKMADKFLGEPKPYYMDEEKKWTGKNCSVCGEPQWETPSGVTCKNGHGGADPMGDDEEVF